MNIQLANASKDLVHPRACGERIWHSLVSFIVNGSSPRLWGTDAFEGEIRELLRFIPTPVGNGAVRGVSLSSACRFIPTPVGNGSLNIGQHHEIAVHPHACGERDYYPILVSDDGGSSPRLWGTAALGRWRGRSARFIPTPEGNGSCSGVRSLPCAVHPHACGERLPLFA